MTEMYKGIQIIERRKPLKQFREAHVPSFFKFDGMLYCKIDEGQAMCFTNRMLKSCGPTLTIEPVDVRIEVLV